MSEQYDKLLATTENLIKEYEDHPEQLPDLMAFKGQRNFRTYSPRNTMLILNQNPYATYVASYKDWLTLGYKVVKKGGIKILARGYRLMVQQGTQYGKPNMVPVISLPKEEQKVVRAKIKSGELPKIKQPGYYIGNVFDISQTDCPPEDYPKLYHMGYPSSQHALLYDTLKEYIVSKGVSVRELDLNSISLRSRYFPDTRELEINELLNDTEKLSSLTHEYGHALLHNSDTTKPTAIVECEADAVSLLVQSQLGFELTDRRKRHFMNHYEACKNIEDFNLEAMLKSVDFEYRAIQNELIPILEAAVNDMSKVPFMDAYMNGLVPHTDVDQYIEYWHSNNISGELSSFLGMSTDEYNAFLTGVPEEVLSQIAEARKQQLVSEAEDQEAFKDYTPPLIQFGNAGGENERQVGSITDSYLSADPQSENITGTFRDYSAMSSMIGLYEAFQKTSFDHSITRWFGEYAMQVPRDHVTVEQFYRRYQEVISYFPEIDLSKAERFMVTSHRLIDDALSDEARLIALEQFSAQYSELAANDEFIRLLLIRQAAADSLHEAEENLANDTRTTGELDPADAVVLYAALIHMCNDDVKKHQEEHQQILNQKHLPKQAQEVYEQLMKDYDFKNYAQYRSDFDIQKYGDLINDEGFVALLSIRNYAAAELKAAEKAYNAQIADIRSNTSLPEVKAFRQQLNANIGLYTAVIEICTAGIQEYSGQSEPPPLPPGEKTSTGQVKPGGKRQWVDYKEQNKINRQRVKTEISITSLASDMGYDLIQKGSVFGIKRPGERQGDGLSNDLSSVRLYPQSNTYKRHSQPDNHGSTIDFMKHFGNGESGMEFKEAMEKLEGMLMGGVSVNHLNSDAVSTPKSTVKAVESAKKEFVLPEKTNGKFSRSFAYLAKSRCIAPEIIKTVMSNASNGKSYLYQDHRGNTVFVGKDAEGKDAFACLRSNNTDPETTFRGDVAGSNQKVGWMVNNGADTMYVTEAPIDAMSAMTVVSELGVPLEQANYLSLCGTGKTAVFEYHMEQNPNIKNVIFACDNDSAGKEAVDKMQQIVNDRFPAVRTSIHLPKTDLNADLCMKSQPVKGMSQKTDCFQKKSSIKHRVKAVEV